MRARSSLGKVSVVRMSEPATMRDFEGDAVIDDKYDINFVRQRHRS
jgi:hypothetical protein